MLSAQKWFRARSAQSRASVASLVLSIPVSIAANMLTTKIRIVGSKRNEKRIRQRIGKLEEERRKIDYLREGIQGEFLAYCARKIIAGTGMIVLAAALDVIAITILVSPKVISSYLAYAAFAIAQAFLYFVAFIVSGEVKFLRNVENFGKYEEKLDKQLAELNARLPSTGTPGSPATAVEHQG
jgi:hypothetical protein